MGAGLGAFLLIGLVTRFWALVGIGQAIAIMLSVANAPHEWIWSYLLMILLHAALFATAAGRYWVLTRCCAPLAVHRVAGRPGLLAVAS